MSIDTEHYFWELFKQGFCDTDIWAEDNTAISKVVNSICKKFKDIPTIANKMMLALAEHWYIYDEKEMRETRGFTIAYLLFYKWEW